MSTRIFRPLSDTFRSALKMIESDPGPITPEKMEFIDYLRRRITEHESLDRSCTSFEHRQIKD